MGPFGRFNLISFTCKELRVADTFKTFTDSTGKSFLSIGGMLFLSRHKLHPVVVKLVNNVLEKPIGHDVLHPGSIEGFKSGGGEGRVLLVGHDGRPGEKGTAAAGQRIGH